MQTEVTFESPNLLLSEGTDAAQGTIVVLLGGILKFALFFITSLLISILAIGMSITVTGWVLGDLGLG